jgi:hypothetical protein
VEKKDSEESFLEFLTSIITKKTGIIKESSFLDTSRNFNDPLVLELPDSSNFLALFRRKAETIK